jgi:anti-sigma factor RsiW
MSSLLRQLETNEAILLMYLADELPPEDRAEVERRLAGDPSLQALLASMKEAQASAEAGMAELDRSDAASTAAAHAAERQVARLIRQWQTKRLAEGTAATVAVASHAPQRSLWWTYPTAAAAAVLLAVVTWWSYSHGPTQAPAPSNIASNQQLPPGPESADQEQLALNLTGSFDAGRSLYDQERNTDLSQLEQQVVAMTDDTTSTSNWHVFPASEDLNP